MKRALIVDDDPLIVFALSRGLRGHFGELVHVSSEDGARVALLRHFFDICFLDVNLHSRGGLDLLERIGYLSPATEIVVMTASHPDESLVRRVRGMSCQLVLKPFDMMEIRRIAQGLEEKTRLSRAPAFSPDSGGSRR